MTDQKELSVIDSEAQQDTTRMVEMIGKLAMDPDVSVDKMERMLAMSERILDRKAQQDFVSAMVRVQQKIPAIKKHNVNSQTNSTYADLDFINSIIKPIYTAEGFSLTFGTNGSQIPGTVLVVCDVLHIGGFSKQYTYDAPIDDKGIKGTVNKTETHARGSANTYGQRYLVKMIFNITLTNEDDDGNAAGEPILNEDLVMLINEAANAKDLQAVYENDCKRNTQYTPLVNARLIEINKAAK